MKSIWSWQAAQFNVSGEENMEEREILLNLMYTGKFLQDKEHIGHEIINLFQDDAGQFYIYILPVGTICKKHNDKIDSILLTRRHNDKKIEILAKAVGLRQLAYIEKTHDLDWRRIQKIELKSLMDHVKYGGVLLKNIKFCEKDEAVFVTFKADRVLKVKKPLYITTQKSLVNQSTLLLPDVGHFPRQSQKKYISNVKHPKSYRKLQNLLSKSSLWGEKTKKISISANSQSLRENNFMQIIKKEYDELAFSNMFAYIFESNPTGFQKFAQKCLGVSHWGNTFEIKREYKNIDILLSDGKKVLIIENKIKSGLNGKIEDKDQLDKYWKIIAKDPAYKGCESYGFVFVPDYNSDVMEEVQKQHKGKYTCIPYSQVYKFFEQYRDSYRDVPYYDEFLSAIKKHTSLVDNYLEEETYKKFLAAIRRGRLYKNK